MRTILNNASALYNHRLFWPVVRLVFFAVLIFIALTQYIIGWAYLSPEPSTIPTGQSAEFTVITNRGELQLTTTGAYRLDCEGDPYQAMESNPEEYWMYAEKGRVNNREKITLHACTQGRGWITLYQPGFGDTVAFYPVSLSNGELVESYRFIPEVPAAEMEPTIDWDSGQVAIEWQAGQVWMETRTFAHAGHHLEFTDLDGGLILRLDFDDAAVSGSGDRATYAWGACTQPWLDGEKLWAQVRMSDEPTLTHVTNDTLPCAAVLPKPEPAPVPELGYDAQPSSAQPPPRSWWPPSYKMWCAEPTGCPLFGWVVLLPSALCMAHSLWTILRGPRQRTRAPRRR